MHLLQPPRSGIHKSEDSIMGGKLLIQESSCDGVIRLLSLVPHSALLSGQQVQLCSSAALLQENQSIDSVPR